MEFLRKVCLKGLGNFPPTTSSTEFDIDTDFFWPRHATLLHTLPSWQELREVIAAEEREKAAQVIFDKEKDFQEIAER